ncbi:DUF7010 family protein [Simiduia aestuariiviva]|uniref:Uncharacterized protein n=1 Tax=Simiduia aestuariiviva TaxID=1510459 RepID=A0A839UPK4_9GAMM|nr:hypothetical protein [Simiduia aestuariiviva]MBB3167716.1 hypothetical protein [Simiduia aestuariiviva]
MDIQIAQSDMRSAYLDGLLGVMVSGLVWTGAAVVSLWASAQLTVWLFFVGGALIHPLAVLMAKLCGASGRHRSDNPLAGLALASTAWLIFSLPIVYGIFLLNPLLFFPAMLLVIGGRYLTFATLYGLKAYWGLGLLLAFSAYPLVVVGATSTQAAALGAFLEVGFASVQLVRLRLTPRSVPSE